MVLFFILVDFNHFKKSNKKIVTVLKQVITTLSRKYLLCKKVFKFSKFVKDID